MQNSSSSVTQSGLTICDPMDCSMPGFLSITNSWSLLKLMTIRVSGAIQPSHPLLSPSPPVFSLSSIRVLFPVSLFFGSGGQSIGISALASVLPVNIQG